MESRRGDIDSLEATELRLGLPGTEKASAVSSTDLRGTKRPSSDCFDKETPAKTQVVGWPPVRSFRKNTFHAKKNKTVTETTGDVSSAVGLFVKVSMDGAPYLRKIDLSIFKGYKELRHALDTMFKCFSTTNTTGDCGSEFSVAYEDKDGDLMLAGDVPWEMFSCSCKRLRIMKGSEAKGLVWSANHE
ncbi:Auxin responsive protein [Zostera marina]|uniref:Auxin-responsive protein n=1 Tax=Zostera marina TaxID=29655 RepID=A0A0K9PXX5_ZOSMR|nr:Auxin responsive protein [Zostera marina]